MTHRKEALVFGEYFHVYNRGNSKQNIFIDDRDRERFVKLLYLSNSKKNICFRDDIVDKKINALDFDRGETLVSIGAWVLMPNHFHIYLTPREDFSDSKNSRTPGVREEIEDFNKNITLFMHKLCMSYSKYFNIRHKRTGSLYEGPFKAVHVENDVQAKYVFSYIHLNPLKLIDSSWRENEGINSENNLEYLDHYRWSSYYDNSGNRRSENKILDLKSFPEYFLNIGDFKKDIFSWLDLEIIL
ncbi:MAG: hypothetical protein NDI62_02710 [Burkholderiales bacterium]|nr:hypothetical protein [Burkholderiales bacterium]